MSTPLSLKQLCDAAGQKKWKARGGTVSIDSPHKHEQEKICSIASPTGAACEAWEGINNRRASMAQLIARLSPEVAMTIYKELQLIQARATHHEMHGIAEQARTLIDLLDGLTP